jgi:hypothetical protein
MKPSQEEVEAAFSQRNIHDVLHSTISYELDNTLHIWAIGAFIRVNTYLDKQYYTAKGELFTSKNTRIEALRDHIAVYGLDDIMIALVAAVIRNKEDQTIQQVIGYLQAYMPHEDHFDRAQTAGELIAVTAHPGRLYQIERPESSEAPRVKVNYWPLIRQLFQDTFRYIEDTFFNPPLISPPKEVTSRHSCGYYTFDEKVILGSSYTQHDDQLDLETLNILGKIPWTLDPFVIAQPEPLPAKCVATQDILNFRHHADEARRVYDVLGSESFYIPWQYCSRGRLYTHGHHVNLQSYTYKKVALNFNDYQIVTL